MKIFILLTLLSQFSFAQSEIDKAMTDAQKVEQDMKNATPVSEEKKEVSKVEIKKEEKNAKKEDSEVQKLTPGKIFKLTKEESEMLKRRYKSLKSNSDLAPEEDKKKEKIYVPAPVSTKEPLYSEDSLKRGYVMDKDSPLILHKYISYKDVLTVRICFSNALSLTLDETIDTPLQSALTDDIQFVGAAITENKRGAVIHLKQPVPEGVYWESAVRLVRKSDDKTYLINLLALPCPQNELNSFPRIVYLKDGDVYKSPIYKRNKVMTPEDNIIQKSKGLPRLSKKRITVYDMVTSPGSDWAVFGVELQIPNNTKEKVDLNKMKFLFLDNFQINDIKSQIEYMPIPSEKVTQMRGVSTFRFKATVNINKQYMKDDRYLYMMYVDEEDRHYQYIRIDTLNYFNSLKKRGLEI